VEFETFLFINDNCIYYSISKYTILVADYKILIEEM